MESNQDPPDNTSLKQDTAADAGTTSGVARSNPSQRASKAGARGAQSKSATGRVGGDIRSGGSAGNGVPTDPDAIALLKADHREAEKLFTEYELADDARKADIVREVCNALTLHTRLEEEIFYPACRDKTSDEDPLDEAQVEHDSAKLLIADLMRGDERDRYRDAKISVLAEQVKHHVAEEEKARTGIFAKAKQAGLDLTELGQRIQRRKQELQDEGDLQPGRPVSFQAETGGNRSAKENEMATNQTRDRDDRGRFQSDDDNSNRGGSGGNRSRDDDGRFTSSRGGRDDDDDRGGRNNGRGNGGGRGGSDDGRGWFGDSEGHSEAARRGWDDRGSSSRSSRSSRDDDNYDRSRSSSRGGGRSDDDDNRGGRGNGRGGWFGESEGHSEASRRGWEDRDSSSRSSRSGGDSEGGRGRMSSRGRDDDDDRGNRNSSDGRGWFGDPQGHSEASRRGWDDRGSSSRSSRGSRDDDDDRGNRGNSRGDGRGWFGDSEGHSQAARRGRDDDDVRGRSNGRGRDSRDDDDGRGWYGDSRGHSEASRRGWENRR